MIEYAQYIGMNLEQDMQYFYICREGLKASLPDPWKPYKNRKGDIYYVNTQTQEVSLEHPCDAFYK